MRRLLVVAALTAGALVPASASAHQTKLTRDYKHLYYTVKRELGPRAPGRQIASHGVRTKTGVRAATKSEIVRSMRQLRKLLAPPPRPMLVRTAIPPRQPPAGVATASVTGNGTLQTIAQCESGGDPRAVSADGRYTGLVQFDDQTWHSVGGTGRAMDAPASEQYRRAALLYAQRGSAPWPVCGR